MNNSKVHWERNSSSYTLWFKKESIEEKILTFKITTKELKDCCTDYVRIEYWSPEITGDNDSHFRDVFLMDSQSINIEIIKESFEELVLDYYLGRIDYYLEQVDYWSTIYNRFAGIE